MPRYWLSGEEKKLLYKLRTQKARADSGDYWRHLIPRNDKEFEFLTSLISNNAIEEARDNEAFSWREKQTVMLPDGTKELREILFQANLKSSLWYFEAIQPWTLNRLPEGLATNQYESKDWIPQIFDIFNNTWRKASEWESEHWNDLVNCPSCNHPTIPQFQCNVCGENLSSTLKDIEKRVLTLICILPDSPEEVTTDDINPEETIVEEEESEEEAKEPTELEDVIEEETSEKVIEREEDEETKETSDN